MITMEFIFALVTAIVTTVLATILKKKVVPKKYIPLQNLIVGIISSVVAIAIGLYDNATMAVLICLGMSMGVGGAYDLSQTNKKE